MDDACYYLHEHGLNGYHCCHAPANATILTSPSSTSVTPRLLVWSASDQKGLRRVLDGYDKAYHSIVADSDVKLDQLAYTLAARRSILAWRTFAIVRDPLVWPGSSEAPRSQLSRSSTTTNVAFIFTGQGSQYAGMGLDLLHYPTFRQALLEMDAIYAELGCRWSGIGKAIPGLRTAKLFIN